MFGGELEERGGRGAADAAGSAEHELGSATRVLIEDQAATVVGRMASDMHFHTMASMLLHWTTMACGGLSDPCDVKAYTWIWMLV